MRTSASTMSEHPLILQRLYDFFIFKTCSISYQKELVDYVSLRQAGCAHFLTACVHTYCAYVSQTRKDKATAKGCE